MIPFCSPPGTVVRHVTKTETTPLKELCQNCDFIYTDNSFISAGKKICECPGKRCASQWDMKDLIYNLPIEYIFSNIDFLLNYKDELCEKIRQTRNTVYLRILVDSTITTPINGDISKIVDPDTIMRNRNNDWNPSDLLDKLPEEAILDMYSQIIDIIKKPKHSIIKLDKESIIRYGYSEGIYGNSLICAKEIVENNIECRLDYLVNMDSFTDKLMYKFPNYRWGDKIKILKVKPVEYINCPICLEDREWHSVRHAIPCGHGIHPHCVAKTERPYECPCCRGTIEFYANGLTSVRDE